ncbi:DUF3847 domain-containing protein [bacterium D16-50]|nr:DUF3847 domain-containing protein [bacterium D16-50]
MSIKPEYVEKILQGTKKFEYRKRLAKKGVLVIMERRVRTHRLCARGGYLESIVPELIAMTDEE